MNERFARLTIIISENGMENALMSDVAIKSLSDNFELLDDYCVPKTVFSTLINLFCNRAYA